MDMLSDEKIVMFSTSWCSDCSRAKYILDEYGIEYIKIGRAHV